MRLYDSIASPNPFTVRLFIAERGGLALEVRPIDLMKLENRRGDFRAINPFGTLPALQLDDGTVLSDIVAVCEYLDEVAKGGRSLVGEDSRERAVTRMWTRKVDQGIAQRFTSWWRGSDEARDLYHGHRIAETNGRSENRQIAEMNLNSLDERLEVGSHDFICGDRPMLADILMFAFMHTMKEAVPWLLNSGRPSIQAWYEIMLERPAVVFAKEEVKRIAN